MFKKTSYFYNLSFYYSVLRDSTGSFFAAILAGMNPARTVRNTLIIIRIIAAIGFNVAIFEMSE